MATGPSYAPSAKERSNVAISLASISRHMTMGSIAPVDIEGRITKDTTRTVVAAPAVCTTADEG